MVQKSADSIASSRAARLAGNRQREGWRRQKFPHRHAPSTVVLPVPGLPENTQWWDEGETGSPSSRRRARTLNVAVSLWISSFTGPMPTSWSSSTRTSSTVSDGSSSSDSDDASVSIRSPSSSSGCSDGICVIPLHSIAMFTAIAEEITENGILHVCLLRGRDTGLPVLGEEFLLGAFEIVHMPVLSCPCAPPHATRAVTFPTAYTSLPHPTSYSLLLRQ